MTIDWTRPIRFISRMGDSYEARVICTDRKSLRGENFVILYTARNEMEYPVLMNSLGESEAFGRVENIPEEITGYINIFGDGSVGRLFPRPESTFPERVLAQIEVVFVDGKPVSTKLVGAPDVQD